ncbi:lipooligosaccharide transport system permease protein [Allocatelliglobosispora scoriae]|uniref:Transport permease protein n=1 Tax=Allocatelliglobosispora scoriae TaxID=643052 RepID=A0A841BH86_9ACTN|nr:ABC transporter permease [Allocatelliglobosispora scoriae]MBB5868447.1 lipooligosaccharide transport system permease protein [Allocatelliglobosispora scoriae]
MSVLTATPATTPRLRGGRARTMVERNLMIYRHTWIVLVAEIFEPLLYLVAFGVGIGMLVGDVPGLHDATITYPQFVAPALLATAAMNGAMNETTFNMYSKLTTDHTYESILTTPMTVRSVALGEICWALLRGFGVSGAFLGVVAAFGLVHSPWALLALPGALLIGFAFAAIGLLTVTFLRSYHDFQLIQLVMLPMFLFATTFYPLGVYPRPIQIIVEFLPLYHAIELVRDPFLGAPSTDMLIAAAYLAVLGVAALLLAIRRLGSTLRR